MQNRFASQGKRQQQGDLLQRHLEARQQHSPQQDVLRRQRERDRKSDPPVLADPRTRKRLTPAAVDAIVRLAPIWRLTSAEVCELLGNLSLRTWYRMKKGEWSGSLSQDTLTRVSVLVGIFKGLRLLFSKPLADEWVRLPNAGPLYGKRRPLDAIIEGGIPKMLEVRRHIDALRGGL